MLHHPSPQNVAVQFDAPWEGCFSGYKVVIRDDDVCRLCYHSSPSAGEPAAAPPRCCYAESHEGITFTRPSFGLHEFAGSRENNLILVGDGADGFAPSSTRALTWRPTSATKRWV